MNGEIEWWKEIAGYEGYYEVSNLGNVRTIPRTYMHPKKGIRHIKQHIVNKRVDKNGYILTSLSKDGNSKTFKVHRLVANAFIPNPENKEQVNHKFGIKADNRSHQLEWSTNLENSIHARQIGLINQLGEENKFSKLNNEQVLEIYNSTLTTIELSAMYNTCRSNVYHIKRGLSWTHITNHKKVA